MLYLFSTGPAKVIPYLVDVPPYVSQWVSFVVGVVASFLLIVLLGAITRNFFGRRMVQFGESAISKIPFARTFYLSVKQIVQAFFFSANMKNMKRVVLVEYPRKGIHAIGFVTAVSEPRRNHNVTDRKLVNLFIPTTPNPTSGIYVMVAEDDLLELNISVEDAFRLIVSAGISQIDSDVFEEDKKND